MVLFTWTILLNSWLCPPHLCQRKAQGLCFCSRSAAPFIIFLFLWVTSELHHCVLCVREGDRRADIGREGQAGWTQCYASTMLLSYVDGSTSSWTNRDLHWQWKQKGRKALIWVVLGEPPITILESRRNDEGNEYLDMGEVFSYFPFRLCISPLTTINIKSGVGSFNAEPYISTVYILHFYLTSESKFWLEIFDLLFEIWHTDLKFLI